MINQYKDVGGWAQVFILLFKTAIHRCGRTEKHSSTAKKTWIIGNMQGRRLTILLCAQLFLAGCFDVLAAPTPNPQIVWFKWDLPPEFIRSGGFSNQGYVDKILQRVIEQLPNFDHSVLHVNIPRWSREATKPGRCASHIWSGFYKDNLIYSKPYGVTPPHGIIAHKRLQSRLGTPGTVISLAETLKDPDLTLVIMPAEFTRGVNYSRYPVLYPILSRHLQEDHVVELSTSQNSVNLKTLARGHFDYTIGYKNSIKTQQRIDGLNDEYVFYPLKEHDFYKKVYIACNNDAFGKQVIQKVNAMINEDMVLEFLRYQEEWNDDDLELRTAVVDHFINGKVSPLVVE